MTSRRCVAIVPFAAAVLLGLVLWAQAGDLNPPSGPVAPTMKTLDQLSAEHAQLASAIAGISGGGGGGGVKQVVRGVVSLPSGQYEVSQEVSPSINPSKSVVVLSDAVVLTPYTQPTQPIAARNGSCLVDLTSTTITVRVDDALPAAARKVGFQIIEYN